MKSPTPACIEHAVDALRRGQLVVMPTDTVYGVAARPGAEERIFAAKSRDRGKPIPLLAAGVADVVRYGAKIGALERRLARAFWPGPLTLVLRVGRGTEGFRIPDHPVARKLIRRAGGVLRVTSANVSGEAPALTARAAKRALGAAVSVTVDAGRSPGGVPSTVAAVKRGKVVVLREGAITLRALQDAARK